MSKMVQDMFVFTFIDKSTCIRTASSPLHTAHYFAENPYVEKCQSYDEWSKFSPFSFFFPSFSFLFFPLLYYSLLYFPFSPFPLSKLVQQKYLRRFNVARIIDFSLLIMHASMFCKMMKKSITKH